MANYVKSQLEEGKGKVKLKHSDRVPRTAKSFTEVKLLREREAGPIS